MKIAIDTFVLDRSFRNQGSYVYTRNVLGQFEKIANANGLRFQLFVSPNAASDAHQFGSKAGFELIRSDLIARTKLWRMGASSFALSRRDADLAYFPAPVNCLFSRTPAVVTVYDATVLTSPSQTLTKSSFERAIIWHAMRSASRILTLSHTSKSDLSRLYGISPEKIAVVYLGYDRSIFRQLNEAPYADADVPAALAIHKPYIMHHGLIQPRKNLERLIEAYRLTLDRNPSLDFDLVLVGALGWRSEGVLKLANREWTRGRVVLTGAVPDTQLASLIRRASLCVVPSLYEGFCLPLLESMACGTPTIASRTSCLPEISGRVLRYFDPFSIEEMCQSITEGLCNTEMRKELSAGGLRRAAEFSWQRCGEETLAVLMQTYSEVTAN